MLLLLLGAPGSGKGTQAKKMAECLDLEHVASGDLLRDNQARGTSLGVTAQGYMEQGILVPDELVVAMVMDKLGSDSHTHGGVILDGFPRTIKQAQALELELEGDEIDYALFINVPEPELIRRMSGRLVCRTCQAPHQKTASVCDRCGGQLYQRDDDNVEAVRKRIEVYRDQTTPLIEFYRSREKLIEVDGYQDVETVGAALIMGLKAHL